MFRTEAKTYFISRHNYWESWKGDDPITRIKWEGAGKTKFKWLSEENWEAKLSMSRNRIQFRCRSLQREYFDWPRRSHFYCSVAATRWSVSGAVSRSNADLPHSFCMSTILVAMTFTWERSTRFNGKRNSQGWLVLALKCAVSRAKR